MAGRKKSMLKNKKALISGASGQDGRLMAEYLLKNFYTVVGLSQSSSQPLKHSNYIHAACHYKDKKQIFNLVNEHQPQEVYHFAANSFPGTTAEQAEQLVQDNITSCSNLISACIEHVPQSRFFNASSAYIFKPQPTKYTLSSSVLSPSSPYGISKLRCYEIASQLRKEKNYFVVNGVLFNHESIYRDERFVTVKIIKAAIDIKNKTREVLELGNLNVTRDWSHASDFIPAIHKSLAQEKPKDYIFSSGIETSLQQFINITFQKLGMNLEWIEDSEKLIAKEVRAGVTRIISKKELLRENDYSYLVGDNCEAIQDLGLKLVYSVDDIIDELIQHHTKPV